MICSARLAQEHKKLYAYMKGVNATIFGSLKQNTLASYDWLPLHMQRIQIITACYQLY